ncbi:VOC family protein [Promicromonospora sukumoe]|uniref:VOC family protein n=1 Tax=Promicromonospora sukumoe TaxID=88382 RepID=UPI0003AB2F68|nr:VOC family protein [Promicromonospora sukumoe]
MARLHDVVFDCRHPASLARFWAIVLDGYAVAPYDDEELARLRTLGVHDPEDDPSVLVEGPAGAPRLFFNAVPEPKSVKNRVHLDVRAPDRDAEVARLVAAGASEIGRHENWVVMTDPESNEFCVFPE